MTTLDIYNNHTLLGKVDSMQEQMGNASRDVEILGRTKKKC